jgi:hypothetical protein
MSIGYGARDLRLEGKVGLHATAVFYELHFFSK